MTVGKIMTKFIVWSAKTYSYLIDDGNKDKNVKGTKKLVIKGKLKFENYENCLKASKLENKITHIEKNKIDLDGIHENHKELIKKAINQYEKHNKNSKVFPKKLIRLL